MYSLIPRNEGRWGWGGCACMLTGLGPISTKSWGAYRMSGLVRYLKAQVPFILLSFRDILCEIVFLAFLFEVQLFHFF